MKDRDRLQQSRKIAATSFLYSLHWAAGVGSGAPSSSVVF